VCLFEVRRRENWVNNTKIGKNAITLTLEKVFRIIITLTNVFNITLALAHVLDITLALINVLTLPLTNVLALIHNQVINYIRPHPWPSTKFHSVLLLAIYLIAVDLALDQVHNHTRPSN